MNKAELVKAAGVKKEALDAILNAIEAAVKNGENVVIPGFGSFVVKERAERKGINPLTKQAIVIPAKKAVAFKAGKGLAL